jgi:hypothetical protein
MLVVFGSLFGVKKNYSIWKTNFSAESGAWGGEDLSVPFSTVGIFSGLYGRPLN